jgi:hypothetical protein
MAGFSPKRSLGFADSTNLPGEWIVTPGGKPGESL